jgi:hypothetical protein
MNIVYTGFSTVAIALLFYSWRDYNFNLMQRQRQLRERVAYMLWVMAHGALE